MGFFSKRSRLEKYLLASTVLFILLSIGLLIGFINFKNKDMVCETPECLIAAAHMQSSLNLKADPCDDFYEYACGGWIKNNLIPPDRSRWTQFDATKKTMADRVRVILEGQYNAKYPSIVSQTMNLYKECMNTTKRDLNGYTELKALLNDIEWPMIKMGAVSRKYNWVKVFAQLNKVYGIDAPSFGVGRAQLINPNSTTNKKIINAYKKFIDESVHLLADEKIIQSELDKQIENLLSFEISLAKITADRASRRKNRTEFYGQKISVNQFMDIYEKIPLKEIETFVFDGVLNGIVSGNIGLIVYDREYFRRLGDILKKTSKQTIANYLSWRFVKAYGSFTTKEFRNIEFEYNKVVSGIQEPKALWEDCVDIVNERLNFAVGRLYVDEMFSPQAKNDIQVMIDHLNEAFKQLLYDNIWMEDITKEEAFNKLNKMLRAIGYPVFIKNNTRLAEYYSELTLKDDSSYFESIQTISLWSTQKSLKRLANNKVLNKDVINWKRGPADVGAFFSPNLNLITFPAGILQSPFYTFGLPAALNLGAIGFVIGHEMTHSFDDFGSQYDETGNLKNWWDDKTLAQFKTKVQCFKDQYSSYNDSLVGITINGNLTIGENIADNGGLRQAFRALQNIKGTKQLLPASMKQFTSEQLFFLSFANVWCNHMRSEALIRQIEIDPHSPKKYRVWGTVSNSEGFAQAFNCKPGSPMNPILNNKCIIW